MITTKFEKSSGCLILRSQGKAPATDFFTYEDILELEQKLPAIIEEFKNSLNETVKGAIADLNKRTEDIKEQIKTLEGTLK